MCGPAEKELAVPLRVSLCSNVILCVGPITMLDPINVFPAIPQPPADTIAPVVIDVDAVVRDAE